MMMMLFEYRSSREIWKTLLSKEHGRPEGIIQLALIASDSVTLDLCGDKCHTTKALPELCQTLSAQMDGSKHAQTLRTSSNHHVLNLARPRQTLERTKSCPKSRKSSANMARRVNLRVAGCVG